MQLTQDINDDLDVELSAEEVMRDQYLTFRVDEREYGVEISCIDEIISIQSITPVPHTHNYVNGIINLRGTVIPIIDMRLRFNLPEIEYTERACIIVLIMDDISIGIIVEEVQEVVTINQENRQAPPKNKSGSTSSEFVMALGVSADGKVKQLLDVKKVFEVDDITIEA